MKRENGMHSNLTPDIKHEIYILLKVSLTLAFVSQALAIVTFFRDKSMGIAFNLLPYILVGLIQITLGYLLYKYYKVITFGSSLSGAINGVAKQGKNEGLGIRLFSCFVLFFHLIVGAILLTKRYID